MVCLVWRLSFLLLLVFGEGSAESPGINQCPMPKRPQHGTWFCQTSKSPTICHLECDPGYAPSSRTNTICLPSHGSWSPSPSHMTCKSAVALITGGLVAATTVEVYGPNIHIKLLDLPDTRVGHTLDYVDSFILACGGSTMKGPPVNPPPPSRNTCIQMLPDFTWTSHSTMGRTRDIAASAVNIGQLTILGGTDFPTKRETMTPAIQNNWREEDIRQIKYACGVKISAEEFMVIGGTYSPTSVTSYNVISGMETTKQDLLQARSGHGCAFIKDKAHEMMGVVVAGGFPGGGAMWTADVSRATTNHTEFYNLKTGEWRKVGDLNMARRGLKLVFVQNVLYAMGGFNGTNYVSTVEQFNFESETWSYVEDMFEARAFPGVVAVPSSMFPQEICGDAGCRNAFGGLGMCVDMSSSKAGWKNISKIIDFSAGTKVGQCSKDCNCLCVKRIGCKNTKCEAYKGICLEDDAGLGYIKAFPCDESLNCFCYLKESPPCKQTKKCRKKKGKCYGKSDRVPNKAKYVGMCNKKAGCKCYKA